MPATLSQNPHSNVSEASDAPEETSRGDPHGIVNLTRGRQNVLAACSTIFRNLIG
jgi:hypothetical protein